MLLESYDGPLHAHGFVSGRSIISNATQHRRQVWTARVDLKDFFPTIGFARVRGLFMSKPFYYPPDVATLLAQLCCHRNGLPQGAPTSPIISNFICRGLDADLARLAANRRCYYTRYADDLCFSTNLAEFPRDIVETVEGVVSAGQPLEAIISSHSFRINPEKTACIPRTRRQLVTGLVVNEKVNVRREYIRRIRTALHIWERFDEADAAAAFERSDPRRNQTPGHPRVFREVIRGHVAHIGAVRGINDPVYRKLASRLETLTGFKMKMIDPDEIDRAVPRKFTVLTEGTTDLHHLQAAERYFHERGDFLDLEFVVEEHSACGNDQKVKSHCDEISKIETHSKPQIGIVDQDTSIGRNLAKTDQSWEHLGNGVVLMATPTPNNRTPGESICIEMYYPMDVLELADDDGRRLFLREEFHNDSGLHHSGKFTIPNVKKTGLIAEEVYRIADGQQVALSKSTFAARISEGKEPYRGLELECFRPAFEELRAGMDTACAYISA